MFGPLENYTVYDVEIANEVKTVPGKWENPEGLGFASAVVFDYAQDKYTFYLGPERLDDLLNHLNGRVAVTFNGIKFDSRVLLGNDREVDERGTTTFGEYGWGNYDLLLEYIKARFEFESVLDAESELGNKAIHDGSFSLDGLSEGTFGLHKTGHGANAPILYQELKYDELLDYNLMDVRLTKKLFEFVRQYSFVVDRMGRVIRFL